MLDLFGFLASLSPRPLDGGHAEPSQPSDQRGISVGCARRVRRAESRTLEARIREFREAVPPQTQIGMESERLLRLVEMAAFWTSRSFLSTLSVPYDRIMSQRDACA
jgi:hypothetical protein